MMLMPTSLDSNLPVLGQQATTVLTPTTVSTLPTLTTTIQPMTSKDTTWTKLFVGGLPYHTTDKSLREHFEVFGDIEEAVVITDRSTGKSRGYGFVIMSTKDCAERACKEPNPIIDGRKANVNLAILGAKPRGNVTASLPLTALRPGFPILQSQYGQPVPTAATTSPYLQQLYMAGNPYMHPGLLNLGGQTAGGPDPYQSNPLLDFYNQYAASLGFPGAAVTQAMVPQIQSNAIDSQNAAAQAQAAMAAAGGYFGYTYAPISAQHLAAAAGLPYATAASPGAPAGVTAQPPPTQSETRIQ